MAMTMTAAELLETMRTALAEEREAVRRFDAVGIAQANARKDLVLRRLRETPPSERGPLFAALDELKADLHANLTLLIQAQAYVREAKLAGRLRSAISTADP